MNPFENSCQKTLQLIEAWEPRLLALPKETFSNRINSQNRSIKQILGHMVDSASNNTHRIVHLQYRENPMTFPNYATNGNNDRWIAIQDYQHEDWHNLVQLWKYANLHFVHVVQNVDQTKLENQWISGEGELISLRENIEGYLPHLELHLREIEELINP
ncbi:hypothetical protein AQPE_1991 [Aquipluma nitroreducens]|uniref:DinB-like domain-containing protein n=1 Tax=Aquipluma nitroreducens TaxID=2010828 RepID=A0A5K7S8F1_9BACT|nr:hypothetical protein [Aquipluma nitroreducens]BBE17833.1 hypothetical protein AQPE_1991 [Aquipluma nitroreducens]